MKSDSLLRLLVLACALFSPCSPAQDANKNQEDLKTEVFIIFDDSSSMDSGRTADNQTYLDAAKKGVRAFLKTVQEHSQVVDMSNIHIVPLNGTPYKVSPKADRLETAADLIEARGGTPIQGATAYIRGAIRRGKVDHAIIVGFTDGQFDGGVEEDLTLLMSMGETTDINLQFFEIGQIESYPSGLKETFDKVNKEMQAKGLPVVRNLSVEGMKDFTVFSDRLKGMTHGLISKGLKKKIAGIFEKIASLKITKAQIASSLKKADELKGYLDPREKAFHDKVTGITSNLDKKMKDMDKLSSGEAAKAYAQAIKDLRVAHNDSIPSLLRDFDSIVRDLENAEGHSAEASRLLAALLTVIDQAKKAAEELKKNDPASYMALSEATRNWLETGTDEAAKDMESLTSDQKKLAQELAALRKRVGNVKSASVDTLRTLEKDRLAEYRRAYERHYGSGSWGELMKSGASAGMYYDRASGEYVLTGVHITGGPGSGGGPSGHSNITVRNEGVIINLPGGGGGGTTVAKFINNGTIITSMTSDGNGGFTLFLNNGNIIKIPAENVHHHPDVKGGGPGGTTFVRMENGFLLFRIGPNGELEKSLFVRDIDLVHISYELQGQEKPTLPSYLKTRFKDHSDMWASILETLLGPNEGQETLEFMDWRDHGGTRNGALSTLFHTGVSGAEMYGAYRLVRPTFNTPEPKAVQRLETALNRAYDAVAVGKTANATLKGMLDGVNEKIPALTTLENTVAKAGGGLARPKLVANHLADLKGISGQITTIQEGLATSLDEASGVLSDLDRTIEKSNMARLKDIGRKSLRWGGGAVLMYDAMSGLNSVWRLDVNPGWRGASFMVPTTEGERIKNWFRGKGHLTGPERRQLKTEEFFDKLDE